jgi:tetratricopeptide (TPR) repeat protein
MAALVVVALTVRAVADDSITKRDGTVITGQIVGVSGDLIMFQSHSTTGSIVKLPYHLSDIQSVNMATPDAVTQVKTAAPADVIKALQPVVDQFAGLPANWVVGAMAQLARAYAATNQNDKALAVYTRIDSLYPNSPYHSQVVAGQAAMSLQQGKVDEALAAVQPIVDKANQDISPSPDDSALYANAFLVYGQALQAQKKNEQALEAYLTVKTTFYRDPALAEQAEQLAAKLRDANPGLGVP